MGRWIWVDYLFVAALAGIVLIDLSFDLTVMQHGASDKQALADATNYYIHAKASPFLSLVIPLIIVVLGLGGLSRVFVYRSLSDVLHLIVLLLLAPLFILFVSPAQQKLADNHASLSPQQVSELVSSIGQGHLAILGGCIFALLLHASRFTVPSSSASSASVTPKKTTKKN